jgi:branched-chain amino acid transport system ATP-binding protein
MLLETRDLVCCYGRVVALKGVSLGVNEGEVVALIGANGAGKSTLLRSLAGLLPPRSGETTFLEKRIDQMPAHSVVRLGMVLVPEGRRVFAPMTVTDNLKMGAYIRGRDRSVTADMDRMFDYFPVLKQRRRQYAGSLSGGEQQMLAVARALMTSPRLVLMDEPSMGLSPIMVETVAEMISTMQQAGISILLVEQNATLALSVSSRAYVLEMGRVVLEGDAKVVAKDHNVRKAYLGG